MLNVSTVVMALVQVVVIAVYFTPICKKSKKMYLLIPYLIWIMTMPPIKITSMYRWLDHVVPFLDAGCEQIGCPYGLRKECHNCLAEYGEDEYMIVLERLLDSEEDTHETT